MKKTNTKSGFSLIELLVAMVILSMIITILGMLFTESDRAWNIGTSKAEVNMMGRAALNLIMHDMQYAIADSQVTFVIRDDGTPDQFGLDSAEIAFVSLQNRSDDSAKRTAREIFYWVKDVNTTTPTNRFELWTAYYGPAISAPATASSHCYQNRNWHTTKPGNLSRAVVIENVAGLKFLAPNPTTGNIEEFYDSTLCGDKLPEYVDIYLEVLTDAEAERAMNMANAGQTSAVKDYVDRHAKRFTGRVFFHNRQGYIGE